MMKMVMVKWHKNLYHEVRVNHKKIDIFIKEVKYVGIIKTLEASHQN